MINKILTLKVDYSRSRFVYIKIVVELSKWGGDSTPIFLTHEHVYFTSLDNDRGPISSAFFERDSMNENELSISL